MADQQATFAINLEDGTSGAAESAANALKSLQKSIQADKAELAALQNAMRNLQGGASVNIEAFRKLKDQIDAKKQSISEAQSSFIALGGTFNKTRPPTDKFQEFAKTAKEMPGPIGGVVAGLGKLKDLLAGNLMVVGLVGIAAAMVAITAAAVAATSALLKYGIAQANARRAELLRLEGLTKMRSSWGFAAGNAKEIQSAVDRVTASTALGRDKVEGYAAQLYRMGLRGENLSQALEGTAIKASVLGDEGAKGFMGWAAAANFAGGSVKKLADDVRARFGGIAAAQMLDLDVQVQKLRENFSALWDDLKIDGLLKAISTVSALFSTSTQSGRALKALIETMFQPMVDVMTALAPIAKRFFQGMVIGALMFGIVLVRIRNWFREAFGGSEVLKSMSLQKAALYTGIVAVALLGIAFAATGVIMIGALVAAMPFIWSAVVAVGALALKALILAAPFILGAIAIGALIAAGYQLYRLWKEIDWTSLGKSIIDGIVSGLKGGASWVIDTVKGLGGSLVKGFKETLGIASPSKAFAKLGVEIPRGVESGIGQGAAGANAAAADMVGVPASGRAGGGAVTVNLGGITVNSAATTAGGMVADLERELASMLERIAAELGAAVPRGA